VPETPSVGEVTDAVMLVPSSNEPLEGEGESYAEDTVNVHGPWACTRLLYVEKCTTVAKYIRAANMNRASMHVTAILFFIFFSS
jgi:hypothetical protein